MDNLSLLSAVEEGNLLQVISFFEPSIKKNLRNTPYQERNDLEQEIAMKIWEKIKKLQSLEVPTFFWIYWLWNWIILCVRGRFTDGKWICCIN